MTIRYKFILSQLRFNISMTDSEVFPASENYFCSEYNLFFGGLKNVEVDSLCGLVWNTSELGHLDDYGLKIIFKDQYERYRKDEQ